MQSRHHQLSRAHISTHQNISPCVHPSLHSTRISDKGPDKVFVAVARCFPSITSGILNKVGTGASNQECHSVIQPPFHTAAPDHNMSGTDNTLQQTPHKQDWLHSECIIPLQLWDNQSIFPSLCVTAMFEENISWMVNDTKGSCVLNTAVSPWEQVEWTVKTASLPLPVGHLQTQKSGEMSNREKQHRNSKHLLGAGFHGARLNLVLNFWWDQPSDFY